MKNESKKRVILAACIFAACICYLISTKSNYLLAGDIGQEQIAAIRYIKLINLPQGNTEGFDIAQGSITGKEQIKMLLEILKEQRINRNYFAANTNEPVTFIWIAIFDEIDSTEFEMSFQVNENGEVILGGGISADKPAYSVGRLGKKKGKRFYESLDKFIEAQQNSHNGL